MADSKDPDQTDKLSDMVYTVCLMSFAPILKYNDGLNTLHILTRQLKQRVTRNHFFHFYLFFHQITRHPVL